MRRLVQTIKGRDGVSKVYRDAEWQEWTVDTQLHNGNSGRYHTDDKADALSHARAIVEAQS